MKIFHVALAASLLVALVTTSACASEDTPPPPPAKADVTHLHDFDFLVGDWRVHHRRLKERLTDNKQWIEFDGTCSTRKLMDGWANVDDNLLSMPGGAYRGVGLRSYDPISGRWAIWWLDGRSPFGDLDPPVKGNFENGVGTFETDTMLRGKTIRMRFTWSHITAKSAVWEQAFSPDGGKTWEMNWHMDFTRVGQSK